MCTIADRIESWIKFKWGTNQTRKHRVNPGIVWPISIYGKATCVQLESLQSPRHYQTPVQVPVHINRNLRCDSMASGACWGTCRGACPPPCTLAVPLQLSVAALSYGAHAQRLANCSGDGRYRYRGQMSFDSPCPMFAIAKRNCNFALRRC